MKSYTAGKNEENLRLLRFCEKVCPSMPKSMLHKAFRNKRIKKKRKKQDADYRLKEGDLIELYINDDKELFKNIYVHKEDVEKIMGFALDWRELPERKASRIIIEKTADLDDQAAWPEQFDYIKDVCTKMKKAFKKYI